MKILDLARPKEEFQNDISWMHLVTSLASWHGSLIFSLLKWCLLTNQNIILGRVLQTMPHAHLFQSGVFSIMHRGRGCMIKKWPQRIYNQITAMEFSAMFTS